MVWLLGVACFCLVILNSGAFIWCQKSSFKLLQTSHLLGTLRAHLSESEILIRKKQNGSVVSPIRRYVPKYLFIIGSSNTISTIMTPMLYRFCFDTLFAYGFLGSKKLFLLKYSFSGVRNWISAHEQSYFTDTLQFIFCTLVFPSSKRFPPYFRSIVIFIIHHHQLRREPQMYR